LGEKQNQALLFAGTLSTLRTGVKFWVASVGFDASPFAGKGKKP
jgi:hypothetical protein